MRGNAFVLQHLAAVAPFDCAISAITRYELWVGIEKSSNPLKERNKVDLLIAAFRRARFGVAAAERAAKVRAFLESQGTPIGPYDTLLAGHALALSLCIVTANVQEFGRVPGLVIENWQV
jgi:tRNA(fMet)-specific endonuclease VapC